MSARVGLLRLHRAGLIDLPAPSRRNGNGRALVHGPAVWPEPVPVTGQLSDLAGLRLEPVADQRASRLWNGLIDRYHYLGYTPLPGAQLRYLIHWDGGVLGAIGFSAAAWKVAARDSWIGWGRAEREAALGRVLNNARFLILPWVQVKNLASKILAVAARRVAEDFPARYGERVVLLVGPSLKCHALPAPATVPQTGSIWARPPGAASLIVTTTPPCRARRSTSIRCGRTFARRWGWRHERPGCGVGGDQPG